MLDGAGSARGRRRQYQNLEWSAFRDGDGMIKIL